MERVLTVAGTLSLVEMRIVDKVELGGGLEGYYVVRLDEGPEDWMDRELAVFDDYFYANTEFLSVGFRIKGALKHLGGYSGERAHEEERVFEHRQVEKSWEGYLIQGPIVADSYLGKVVDVGIPLHCLFTFSSNLSRIKRWREEGIAPSENELDMPEEGDWVRAVGGLYVYLLKELKLLCTACKERYTYLTTSLPTMDELHGMRSVCGNCRNEQDSNAFPDICERCKKKMWQWRGEGVEFPIDCKCGGSSFDFFYDHRPRFVN